MRGVAVVGDNCVDCYQGDANTRYPGGNAVNVAVYLQRAGVPVSYMGVVGNDDAGRYLRACLECEDVDLHHLKVGDGATGKTFVELRNGERRFLGDEYGCQVPFKLDPEQLGLLGTCRLVHFSAFTSWSGGAQYCQPDLARELAALAGGPKLALDFSDTPEGLALFTTVGCLLDYSFFSRSELEGQALLDFTANCRQVTEGTVIVTMGDKGCLAGGRRERNIFVPAEKCTAVDTLGAGDSFIAGFIASALGQRSLSESLVNGVHTATQVIQRRGAWTNAVTRNINGDV